MEFRFWHFSGIASYAVLLHTAAVMCGGCSSSSNGSSPGDAGPAADSSSSSGGANDSGSSEASTAEGGDAGGLSAQAQAGLAASPFPVSITGMTMAQAEQVGMGSYIVNVVSNCGDCHNKPGPPGTGFLAGGLQIGPVQARNLTSDPNHGLRMTQAQFLETLQTGKDQKLSADASTPVSLIVMPWEDFRWMSVTDLTAVYTYLQLVPPDTNDVPFGAAGPPPIPMPTTFTDGAATPGPTLPPESGDAPLFSQRGRAIQALTEPAGVANLSAADQNAYGRGAYLVGSAPCGSCHTNPERPSYSSTKLNVAQWLTGGQVFSPGSPTDSFVGVERSMSANLLGKTNGFIFSSKVNETVFTTTLQKHVHGDDPGMPPLAWPMPTGFEKLVPDDIHALWVYLSNQTPFTGAADKPTQDAALYCSGTMACATGSTCDTASSQCVPTAACTTDADCFACQTCNAGTCAAPVSGDAGPNACIANGI